MAVLGVTKLAGAVPVHTALKGVVSALCGVLRGREKGEAHPVGQQAGLLLASRAHRWPCWQQTLLKGVPWSAQLKKFARHAWRFATGAAVSTGRKGCRLAPTTDAHASTARSGRELGIGPRVGRLIFIVAGGAGAESGWRREDGEASPTR